MSNHHTGKRKKEWRKAPVVTYTDYHVFTAVERQHTEGDPRIDPRTGKKKNLPGQYEKNVKKQRESSAKSSIQPSDIAAIQKKIAKKKPRSDSECETSESDYDAPPPPARRQRPSSPHPGNVDVVDLSSEGESEGDVVDLVDAGDVIEVGEGDEGEAEEQEQEGEVEEDEPLQRRRKTKEAGNVSTIDENENPPQTTNSQQHIQPREESNIQQTQATSTLHQPENTQITTQTTEQCNVQETQSTNTPHHSPSLTENAQITTEASTQDSLNTPSQDKKQIAYNATIDLNASEDTPQQHANILPQQPSQANGTTRKPLRLFGKTIVT